MTDIVLQWEATRGMKVGIGYRLTMGGYTGDSGRY